PLLPGLTLELRPLSLQRSSFVTSSTVRSRLRFARSRAVQRTESPVSSCPVYADSAACRRGVINLETNCVTGSAASNARRRPSSARAVVALEVLVEQDEVAPMRIVLELLRSTECRTLSSPVAKKDSGQPRRKLLRHFEQGHQPARPCWILHGEIVAIV